MSFLIHFCRFFSLKFVVFLAKFCRFFSFNVAIKPHEFVVKSSSMERKQKEETGIVACPNVNSMIARFNHMTRWISSMVLKAENKRVKTLTKFIKIAKVRNFVENSQKFHRNYAN